MVSASERTALPARDAGQDLGPGQLDKISPAEISDDQAVQKRLSLAQENQFKSTTRSTQSNAKENLERTIAMGE